MRSPIRTALLAFAPASIGVLLLLRAASAPPVVRSAVSRERTADYLAALDLDALRKRGCDYASPLFDLTRVADQVGRPVGGLENGADYDFQRLTSVESRLAGVDRQRALERMFAEVVDGSRTDTERHERVANFVARCICHGPLDPTYEDGSPVLDPLVLLELGQGQCGRAARVAVDLWRAGGQEARLVLLGEHVVAEFHYDGGWHYVDPDLFGADQIVRLDGRIPSLAELSRTPLAIDGPASLLEPKVQGRVPVGSPYYPSQRYFGRREDGGRKRYCTKAPLPEDARDGQYGWRGTQCRESVAEDIFLSDLPPRYQPGAPLFESIDVAVADERRRVHVDLRWSRSADRDGDLLGYRVFVASRSRGWSYSNEGTKPEIVPYLSHPDGWRPEMDAALYVVPPSDVELIEVHEERVLLVLAPGRTFYVTVMPFDAHGEAVGRELYRASQELVIST